MRRAHIFLDFEFTDGTRVRPSGTKPTGYGLSWGGDMGQRMQGYFERWGYTTHHVLALYEYDPRRFKP